MWRLSSLCSAKRVGATATGIVLAVSSWRSFISTTTDTDRRQTENDHGAPALTRSSELWKPYSVANCTTDQNLEGHHSISKNEQIDQSMAEKTSETIATHESAFSLAKASDKAGSDTAISRSCRLIRRAMLERGIPGAVVAVMKDGKLVWSEGIGYADVENDVPCTSETSMRIASISKPLTTVALMQLWQKGQVDLDAPIQNYVPEFPEKEFDREKVVITTRQLLSHLSGIRHYSKVQKDGKLNR